MACFEVTLPWLAAELEEYLREDAILKRCPQKQKQPDRVKMGQAI
jgi:hypothetical protein